MKRNVLLIVLTGLIAVLISGCAAKDGESPTHDEMKGKKVTISTGDYFEACDLFSPGTTVEYFFTSTKPVIFDVHFHDKRSKKFAVDQQLTDNASGSFVVEKKAHYCCMWENKNAKAAKLTYGMQVKK